MDRRAFTLIELLVVISVIGILAGMLMPAISLVRESSRKANCGSNQRQIVMEMILYSTEYRKWPNDTGAAVADRGAASQELVRAKMRDDLKAFVCPSSANPKSLKEGLQAAGWTVAETSYAYDWETKITAKPGRVVMADRKDAADLTAHRKIAIACYADGHVGNLSKSGSAYPNADGADADIFSGTASDSDANVR